MVIQYLENKVVKPSNLAVKLVLKQVNVALIDAPGGFVPMLMSVAPIQTAVVTSTAVILFPENKAVKL